LPRERPGNHDRNQQSSGKYAETAPQSARPVANAVHFKPIRTARVLVVIAALVIYLGVALIGPPTMPPHAAAFPRATHVPSVAAAAATAHTAIIARTDPRTAEVTRLDFVGQTDVDSEMAPAWFTFRGRVRWANDLGAPVESDFDTIVRFDPQQAAYLPDVVTRDDRVQAADVEICSHSH
jgi:hypothetical protein